MKLEPVTYSAQGREFPGFLADGSQGRPAPGIILFHEGGGLNETIKRRTASLAKLGYVAFAPDLFGEPVSGLDQAKAITAKLREDVGELRSRCRAALEVLRAHPSTDAERLAAIGHCFGGAAALELARDGAPLACVVGFHAGFLESPPTSDDKAIRGKVLACHGAEDPAVPVTRMREFCIRMSGAGVDWQLHLYGSAGHSFTNPEIGAWKLPGFYYDEKADRRSWAAMLALFDEVFA